MNNILWTFQHRVTELPPTLLLTLAGVTIAAGVFSLLGGVGLKKTMYTIIGAFFGAFCSLFSNGSNLPLAAALIGIFALLSLKLQETFLVLVVSAFAAVIGYSILIRPYFHPSSNIMAVIRQIAIGVPYYNWPILMAITAAPFCAISWPPTAAIFSSAMGAALMLAGTLMIMLNNGIDAIRHMSTKREIYLEAFVLSVIIGSFMQLWLLPKIGVRYDAVKKAAKAKVKQIKAKKGESGDSSPKSATWRTA